MDNRRRKVRIEKPTIQSDEEEHLWKDVRKYFNLIPSEPEPNLGRVKEIQEELKKGTYLTPEVMEETTARLAIRFMRKD